MKLKKQKFKFIEIKETKKNSWKIYNLDGELIAELFDLKLSCSIVLMLEDLYCKYDKRMKE